MEPGKQVGHRGLPRSGWSDQGDDLTLSQLETRRPAVPDRRRHSGRRPGRRRSHARTWRSHRRAGPPRWTADRGTRRPARRWPGSPPSWPGNEAMVLSGEVSFSAAMRKTMMASGASGAARPTSPGLVPAQMIRMTRKPGEHLRHRAGERGESLGANHPLPIALRLSPEMRTSPGPPPRRTGSAGWRRAAPLTVAVISPRSWARARAWPRSRRRSDLKSEHAERERTPA